jgi:uncharacterized protein YjiS (DUF1127 family)
MISLARTPTARIPGAETGPMAAKASVLIMLRRTLATWSERRRSRIALSRLSPALLRDIGLDRAIAAGEARLPFWHP